MRALLKSINTRGEIASLASQPQHTLCVRRFSQILGTHRGRLLLHIHKGKIMQIRLKAQSATRTQFKLKGSRLHAGTRDLFL
jgi:hypothetical protein